MRKLWFLLATFILCFSLNIYGDTEGDNLIQNPGFESEDGLMHWNKSAWDNKSGITEFALDQTNAHSGKNSAKIINTGENDARFIQSIKVTPDTYYHLSCWTKVEGIEGDKGANITVEGVADSSLDIKASEQWEFIETYILTASEQTEMIVSVRLGGYGYTGKGKAWFDDVVVNAVDAVPQGAKTIVLTNESNSSQGNIDDLLDTEAFKQTESSNFMNVYLCIYFIIAGMLYYFYKKNRIEIKNGDRYIYVILGCVIILKIILAPIVEGFSTDIGCFKSWSNYAALDLPNFYNSGFFCDYPPLYIYVLFILGKIIQVFNISYDSNMALILIKLPSILADSFTAYLLYREAKKFLNKEAGMMLAMLYAFNPAVILNSTLWGQVDSFFAMFIVLMVIYVRKMKLPEASIMLALAILMKPQGIIFMPILFFEVVRTKNWMTFFSCLANGITTAIITILPFSFHQNPLWIFKLYMNTADGYKYASLNAFNLFALLGANLKPDSETFILLSYGTWGYIFIVLITLGIAWIYLKSKIHFITSLTSACILMGVFMLSARMHERYLFAAVTLLLLAYIYFKDKRLLLLHLGFTFTMFVNTQAVLTNMLKTGYPHISPDNGILIGVSLLNIVLLIYLVRTINNLLLKNHEADISIPSE